MSKNINQIILSVLALGVTTSAFAGDRYESESPKTVVELFTSQGCSSCPPANEFVGTLIDDEDKLVLSYGVTYWDYLGWTDTFGDPAFTSRQKEYGSALNIGFVYTPQIVLNGREHDNRFTSNQVNAVNRLEPSDVQIELGEMDGKLYVTSNAEQYTLVTYKPGWQDVAVTRGENHGRTLRIANVVEDVRRVDLANPLDMAAEPGKAYAALLHDRSNMHIVSASVLTPTK